MFIRRNLSLAPLAVLTIAGSTAGAAVAAHSLGNSATVPPAHPRHSIEPQLDR